MELLFQILKKLCPPLLLLVHESIIVTGTVVKERATMDTPNSAPDTNIFMYLSATAVITYTFCAVASGILKRSTTPFINSPNGLYGNCTISSHLSVFLLDVSVLL